MAARLGNVLYWLGCLAAFLCVAVGWADYRGVDTTGIEAARQRGQTDAQILQQRKASDVDRFDYDGAIKVGYTPTEILDFVVKDKRSKLAGMPDLQREPFLVLTIVAAIAVWGVGRAFRYVLAGR